MKTQLLITKTLIVPLCLVVSPLSGQTNGTVQEHILKSSFNNKEYTIHVLLPKSYSNNKDTQYPVLYALDGKYSTPLFSSITDIFSLGEEIKELIIVNIDGKSVSDKDWQTNRYHDYTPSYDAQADTAIANFFKLPVATSGGAPAFLKTLENQIIPFIEKQYRTNEERVLFGHSLGGLFAGYCLLTRPKLFQKYSINSPSLWWENGTLANQVNSLASENLQNIAGVILTAGREEGDFMIGPVDKFEKALKTNFPELKVDYKIFEDETHLSVVPMVYSRTLRLFYGRI